MSFPALLLISLGVAADAFAVALAQGLRLRRLRHRDALAVAATFGLFQAAMPVVGWALGTRLRTYVMEVDHWIAFGLLLLIGGSMMWQAWRGGDEEPGGDAPVPVSDLLVLGVATSIDALAVGIGLAFLEVSIALAAATIGSVTFVLAFAGVHLGHRAGVRYRGPAEVVGGLVLIAIGTKVLLDHLGLW